MLTQCSQVVMIWVPVDYRIRRKDRYSSCYTQSPTMPALAGVSKYVGKIGRTPLSQSSDSINTMTQKQWSGGPTVFYRYTGTAQHMRTPFSYLHLCNVCVTLTFRPRVRPCKIDPALITWKRQYLAIFLSGETYHSRGAVMATCKYLLLFLTPFFNSSLRKIWLWWRVNVPRDLKTAHVLRLLPYNNLTDTIQVYNLDDRVPVRRQTSFSQRLSELERLPNTYQLYFPLEYTALMWCNFRYAGFYILYQAWRASQPTSSGDNGTLIWGLIRLAVVCEEGELVYYMAVIMGGFYQLPWYVLLLL